MGLEKNKYLAVLCIALCLLSPANVSAFSFKKIGKSISQGVSSAVSSVSTAASTVSAAATAATAATAAAAAATAAAVAAAANCVGPLATLAAMATALEGAKGLLATQQGIVATQSAITASADASKASAQHDADVAMDNFNKAKDRAAATQAAQNSAAATAAAATRAAIVAAGNLAASTAAAAAAQTEAGYARTQAGVLETRAAAYTSAATSAQKKADADQAEANTALLQKNAADAKLVTANQTAAKAVTDGERLINASKTADNNLITAVNNATAKEAAAAALTGGPAAPTSGAQAQVTAAAAKVAATHRTASLATSKVTSAQAVASSANAALAAAQQKAASSNNLADKTAYNTAKVAADKAADALAIAQARAVAADKEAALADARERALANAQMINMSRATAIQQMYIWYAMVAQTMVNNDPKIVKPASNSHLDYPLVATNAFGIPFESGSAPCTTTSASCTRWGPDPSAKNAPLLTGAEFQNGIMDYHAVMASAINLRNQMKDASNAQKLRSFIDGAEAQGWLSAGSYFFDLVNLSGSASPASASQTDIDSGLSSSEATPDNLMEPFATGACNGNSTYVTLCNMMGIDNERKIQAVVRLINNDNTDDPEPPIPITLNTEAVSGRSASTVYGFITNGQIIQLPGQPGLSAPVFNLPGLPKTSSKAPFQLPSMKVGGSGWLMRKFVGPIMTAFYMKLFRPLAGIGVDIFYKLGLQVIEAIVYVPLTMMMTIFQAGVRTLTDNSGVNPIVALAQMGITYINSSINMYLQIVMMDITTLGYASFIIALAMPIVIGWMSIMLAVGFTTAYYVPFLPYMIFTLGVIAWVMAVIEAMVAAPIVALGITHPEGEGLMGSKGEQALMILMNVFLRPALMIIGFISAIALTYVSVWIINTGFTHLMQFMWSGNSMYTDWAGLYAFFFGIVLYTTLYLMVVEKSFNMIYILPDKVLRWIGGQPEGAGEAAAGWAEATKKQVEGAGEKSGAGGSDSAAKATAAVQNQLAKGTDFAKNRVGGSTSSKGS